MLKPLLLAISAGLIFVGCDSKPEAGKPPSGPSESTQIDQEWRPSTLSAETIAKANAAVLDYRKCLSEETKAKAENRADPRDIANSILKNCENRLPAIKAAFDAENVPATISERYLRKTRSQGAQGVLRIVMGIHAERSGEEEVAKSGADNTKK